MKESIKKLVMNNANKYIQLYLKEIWGMLARTKIIVKGRKKFYNDKNRYSELNTRKQFNINKKYLLPRVTDWDKKAGDIGTYFFQDLWCANKIFNNNPKRHFDIGSRVDGFIMALLSFREVTLMDIRPLDLKVEGLNFIEADATTLEGIKDNSIESLSALCSLEHFGLGRYGDPIDPEACFKAFKSIQRVCCTNGKVYISVPVARKDRLEFNAHRIFAPKTIISEFNKMKLLELTVIKSNGETIPNPLENMDWDDSKYNNFGLFEFIKLND